MRLVCNSQGFVNNLQVTTKRYDNNHIITVDKRQQWVATCVIDNYFMRIELLNFTGSRHVGSTQTCNGNCLRSEPAGCYLNLRYKISMTGPQVQFKSIHQS